MDHLLKYKGYTGSVEYSKADQVWYGEILYIVDLVLYEAKSRAELPLRFREAVNGYLDDCIYFGRSPNQPCTGELSVRIGPELHSALMMKALREKRSADDIVREALQQACPRPSNSP